jgi:branched-chain amino acid transport system permease protein
VIDDLKRHRNLLLIAGPSTVVFLIISQFVWKTAIGNWLLFVIPALGVALTATALVLMYRTARFLNFTQIGMGAVAGTLFYELVSRHLLPWAAALVVAVIAGVIAALIVGVIMSLLFFKHPRLVLTVVSIVMLSLIAEIEGRVSAAFRKPGEIQGNRGNIDGPFANNKWEVSGTVFRPAHLIAVLLILATAVGLVLFFKKTRIGIAIRASAENSDRASLLGINVKLLQVGVWALIGFMASLARVVELGASGPYTGPTGSDLTLLLLPLAAAILAKMRSLPIAFFGALGLELAVRVAEVGTHNPSMTRIGVVAVLAVGLFAQRKILATRIDEGTSWRAVKEVRAMPREMMRVGGLRRARIAILVGLGVLVVALPLIASTSTVNSFTQVWVYALIGLSLIILTGWSGQISLGQFAIVTVGALVAGLLTKNGVTFWVAAPAGGIAGALFAFLIGIPALRVRGLYLAVTTLAVAAVLPEIIFDQAPFKDLVPKQGLGAPQLLFLNFEDQRSMYFLCFAFFALFTAALVALRKSRGGRVLIALRDNEDGVQSFGIDVVRTRLIAFALSGFIAAIGGALLVHVNHGLSKETFTAGASVNVFIFVVIGGISTPIGAFLGAFFAFFIQRFIPGIATLVTGVGGLFVLMFIPGGLTQVFFGARDALLRVVAMRKHIIVPSLFADYSPEAWEKRLAPLAPAVQSQGLGALKPDQRYTLPSKVFGKAPA